MKKLPLLLAVLVAAAAHAGPTPTVKLKGIDPAVYLQKRNHRPDVSGELRRLPAGVAVAVLDDPMAFVVDDSAYPAGIKADERQKLRTVEVRALLQGALTSLAQRHDLRAFDLLRRHVAHDDDAVAALAAERLGELDDHRVVEALAGLVKDQTLRLEVRAAACAGLGHVRSQEALEALLPALSSSNKDEIRTAALRALGSLTSRWAWEARDDVATGDHLRAAALRAVQAVEGDADVVAVRDEMLALLR